MKWWAPAAGARWGPLGPFRALEEHLRAVDDVGARVGEVLGGMAAGDGDEALVAHLDGGGARTQALALEAAADFLGEKLHLLVDLAPVGEVLGIGRLG